MKTQIIFALLTAVVMLTLLSQAAEVKAQSDELLPAFILLAAEHSNAQHLAQVKAAVEFDGGRIIHLFPNQAMFAKLPSASILRLENLPGVAGLFTQAVELSLMDLYGPEPRRLAAVWNDLIAPQPPGPAAELAALDHPEEHHDAFIAPDLPPSGEAEIGAASTAVVPGYYQTSEFMAGSVAVGIVLVESDGTIDPSTESWTVDEKQQVFSEIVAALNWWTELDPRANLSFVYDDHFTQPLSTGVEPISRPYAHQQYWIADAMVTLGYDASSYFTQVRDYNNHLRQIFQTDWAFTVFVVDSSADDDNRFSDGYFAYAYLGGPFMVMTSGNNGYGPSNMDAVAAHEIGHIFLALDQYYNASQPCDRRSGYLYIENQNSLYGTCASNNTSVMRGQVYPYYARAIDLYAAGQLGWRDSDGDDIFDPLDVELPITIDAVVYTGNEITVNGATQIIPYPSPSRTSVTINNLTGVQYRLDGQEWQPATAMDSSFDEVSETYEIVMVDLSPGLHTLNVAATDTAGNLSDIFAVETIAVLDPIDGGLNTELYAPYGDLLTSQEFGIKGVAYHLQNGVIAGVEYRIDYDSWQVATPQDGSFDSDYEPFTLSFESLEPGTYLVEAFATDAEGNQETNIASQMVEVMKGYTTLLPFVIR